MTPWTVVLGTVVLVSGCSAHPGEPPGPNETPSIAISLNPSSASTGLGPSVAIDVTLTRAGGFLGPVTLGVENSPSSVFASFSPPTIPSGGTVSTLTLRVGPGPGLGSNTITVVGFGAAPSGLGLRAAQEFTLSIVAATTCAC